MGFYEQYAVYKEFDFDAFFGKLTKEEIRKILHKNKIDEYDFLALLSKQAQDLLEEMAVRARELTIQHFGKTILLYTPMYLGNFCVNKCSYCSYNIEHHIKRKKLSLEEIEEEARNISATGLRHILILTGESKKETPVSYIVEAVRVLKKYFDSISIEIYPLTEEEYREVIKAGVDGLTLYQEAYNEGVYDRVHIAGPKKNYLLRLDAPERACKAGMRAVNIGALLGLYDWRQEAFAAGLHARYLQDHYMDVEVGMSLPRIRPHVGVFDEVYPVEDKDLVQIMTALRIFLPRLGIAISTRERQELRNNLMPLGVTRMSAGVSTEVGGHSAEDKGDSQFEISDSRSVVEMKQAILQRGYQPIFKDWMQI